ncbi:hypothetical protein CDEF62S_00965 [Castellaniella defragrans]
MRQLRVLPCRSGSVQDQRGSVVIIVASVLMIMGALMVSIQMGYDYLIEQRLQKAADLAALSAVQRLKMLTCNQGDLNALARAVASQNGGDAVQVDSVDCGRWAGAPDPSLRLTSAGTDEEPLNAVRVQSSEPVVSLLPGALGGGSGGRISTTATAVVGPPVATFSVGAQLLSLRQDGLVGSILTGIGVSPQQVTILNSAGLANVMITPSGLLQALGLPPTVITGVGTSVDLAKLHNLTLGDLLTAYGTLIGQANPAEVDIGAVQSVLTQISASSLKNVPIQLFGNGGVFANVVASSSGAATAVTSALSAEVGFPDLVGATLLAANGRNFVNLDASVVPGLVSLSAQAVNPPTIVTGPVGTTATNVQTQLKLGIDASLLPGLITSNLPTYLGVANATGKLDSISFDDDSATFSAANASTADLCIGTLPAGSPCMPGIQPGFVDFVKVNLALLSVTVQVRANVPIVSCAGDHCGSVDVPVGVGLDGIVPPPSGLQGPRTQISTSDIETNLVVSVLGLPFSLSLGSLLSPLVNLLNGILTPLIQNVVTPLLGADLNETQIHLYSITRGAPYLVQ